MKKMHNLRAYFKSHAKIFKLVEILSVKVIQDLHIIQHRKNMFLLFFSNSNSCIFDRKVDNLFAMIIFDLNIHLSSICVLNGILNQIDAYLLKSKLVTNYIFGQAHEIRITVIKVFKKFEFQFFDISFKLHHVVYFIESGSQIEIS